MKSLFISYHFPEDRVTDVHGGVMKRMGLFLEAFSRISDELELLFFVPHRIPIDSAFHADYTRFFEDRLQRTLRLTLVPRAPNVPAPQTLERYYRRPFDLYHPSVHPYFLTSGPEQIAQVRSALTRPRDAVFVHRLITMAPLLRARLERLPPVFFDLDDVEHVAHVRNLFAPPHFGTKFLGLPHALPVFLAERRATRLSRRTYVCSEPDRRYVRRIHAAAGVEAMPNSVEIVPRPPPASAPTLLFLGIYSYEPNAAAANWLVAQVWPLVREAVPEARLVLAGKESQRLKSAAAPPAGVEMPGFVADLAALYRDTRVVCCPIFSGSGTRFKVIEAAAFGRPVVSTRIGAEGLVFADGREILLRDGVRPFAEACIRLLRDPAEAQAIGMAARAVAVATYDRAAIVERIMASVRTGLSEGAP